MIIIYFVIISIAKKELKTNWYNALCTLKMGWDYLLNSFFRAIFNIRDSDTLIKIKFKVGIYENKRRCSSTLRDYKNIEKSENRLFDKGGRTLLVINNFLKYN